MLMARLNGDNDTNLSGTLLNTRYSGEYIRFGNDENNLYRIVSHETPGLVKIASANPLKNSGSFKRMSFGVNSTFSIGNTVVGTFLNGDYLTSYIDSTYSNMIEESTTWYLGTVGDGESYKLAKYTNTTNNVLTSSTTTAKVGLLRFGELMAGQFDRDENSIDYWTLTPYTSSDVRFIFSSGDADYMVVANENVAIRPSMNLKSNVIITGGTGTKSDPFVITLGS